MTAPDSAADDTGVGERECCDGPGRHRAWCKNFPMLGRPATPDADATPPPGDGDVDRFVSAVYHALGTHRISGHTAELVARLTDALKSHDAVVGERIAALVEAWDGYGSMSPEAHQMLDDFRAFARGVTS